MKKVLCIIVTILLSLPIVSFADETSAITLNITDGETFYEIPSEFGAYCENAVEISFYLDGIFISKADASGEASVSSLAYGKHTIKAVAIMEDGSAEEAVSEFTYAKKKTISAHSQDFDNADNLNSISSTTDLQSSTGFTYGNIADVAEFSEGKGKSENDDDKALVFKFVTDSKITSGYPYIESTSFVNFDSGIAELEFDIKHETSDDMSTTGTCLWYEGNYFAQSGVYTGTAEAITDQWRHIKYVFDNEAQKVSFYVDGNLIVDNGNMIPSSAHNNKMFRLGIRQTKKTDGAPRAAITFDNFKAVNYIAYKGITSASADENSIVLTVNEGLLPDNISNETVSIKTADGQPFELSSVSYDTESKNLTLTTKAPLPYGREIIATLSKELAYADGTVLGNPYEVRLNTITLLSDTVSFDINGTKRLLSDSQLGKDDVVSATVNATNEKDTDLNAVYVLTARKDGRLLYMKSKSLTLTTSGNAEEFTLSLPPLPDDGEYEINLMVCDSFAYGKALKSVIKLN